MCYFINIIDVWVCHVMYAWNDKTLTEDVSFSHMLSLLQPISRNFFFQELIFPLFDLNSIGAKPLRYLSLDTVFLEK